jgi:hypothetical protein
VFDFEGDGVADVVYADERWVWVFDGSDGTVKMQDVTHSNNVWFEYPTIAGVNADGSADIIVANTPGRWGSLTGLTVFSDDDRSWQPGRRIGVTTRPCPAAAPPALRYMPAVHAR